MLLAITTCVSASRCVDRDAASSATQSVRTNPVLQADQGGKAPALQRSWCRKRETKMAVSWRGSRRTRGSAVSRAGKVSALASNAGRAPVGLLYLIEALQRCAAPCAVHFRSAPSRNMAGTAQSSPMRAAASPAETRRRSSSTLSRSMRPSVCEMSVVASSYTRGYPASGPAGQLGQLAVVATRQTLAHLPDVLLHDVEIVQQPFPGGAHVGPAVGGGDESGVDLIENPASLVQPGEEERMPGAPWAGHHPLPRGYRPGALAEVLGTQQLAPDRTGVDLVPTIRGAGKGSGQQAGQSDGRDQRRWWVAGRLRSVR